MAESAPVATGEARDDGGAVLLVGPPNVGKSALFGRLTGTYVTVSNYPGTTVEVARGRLRGGERPSDRAAGEPAEATSAAGERRDPGTVVDTPGACSLVPTSDDERVTRDLLLRHADGPVVVVGDAKSVARAVKLAIQVQETGLPTVLCLNMADEARGDGIEIRCDALAERLGIAVVETVATRGVGIDRLRRAIARAKPAPSVVAYPETIEQAVAAIAPRLPSNGIEPRALALMLLTTDEALDAWIASHTTEDDREAIARARRSLEEALDAPAGYVLNHARIRRADAIVEGVVERRAGARGDRSRFALWLDDVTTHPLAGIPFLAAVLWGAWWFVGKFGADTLVGLLEEGLFGGVVNPAATKLFDAVVPYEIVRSFFVGEYGVITMALTYSLALVLPIVGTFFIAFGVLEDSGYLPRLAVLVNRAMRRIGLNGKAVLPMVLGLGCDTMATLTTRILETRKERLIVIVLLALGVPCSAQLTVILAMLGSMSALAVGIWLGVVLGVIALVGRLAHALLPGETSDFVLEIPPLRVPDFRNIAVKTLGRIEWYLKEAVPLFVLGTVILFVADRTGALAVLERGVEPMLGGLLGLPKETAAAFIVGFLRRDFGAAGLHDMNAQGLLDPVQVVVAVVTITLFIPCIANFFMIVRERGWKTGLAIAAFVFPFALAVGAALDRALRFLDLPL